LALSTSWCLRSSPTFGARLRQRASILAMRRKIRASSTCLLTSRKGVSLCLCVDVSMGEFYMFIDITERCASVSLCVCVRVCVHVYTCACARSRPTLFRIRVSESHTHSPNHICIMRVSESHTLIRITYASYAYPSHIRILIRVSTSQIHHHIRIRTRLADNISRITCAFTCMYPNYIRVFESHTCRITHAFTYAYPNHICILAGYGVATISRLLKIRNLFWKRAL